MIATFIASTVMLGALSTEPVLKLRVVQRTRRWTETKFEIELSNPRENPLFFYAAPFPGREFHVQAIDSSGKAVDLSVPKKGTQASDIFIQFRKLGPLETLGGSWQWARFIRKPDKPGIYKVWFTYDVRYLAALSDDEKEKVYYKPISSNRIKIRYSKDGELRVLKRDLEL